MHYIVSRKSFVPYFICVFILACCFFNQSYGEQAQSKSQALRLIQQRIESMKETMRVMGATKLPETPTPQKNSPRDLPAYNEPSANFITEPVPPAASEIYYSQTDSESQTINSAEPNRGLYVVPFAGFSIGYSGIGTTNGSVMFGDIDFESDTGSSYGLRVGYSWKYFYLEERVGINSMNLQNKITLTTGDTGYTSGELKSLSFQQALGAKIPLSEKIFFNLGVGVGLSQKKFNYSILAPDGSNISSKSLKDWAFSYDAIFGLEFYPFSHLMAGINYRWSRIEEIDHFSAHDLHLIEGSLGFIF